MSSIYDVRVEGVVVSDDFTKIIVGSDGDFSFLEMSVAGTVLEDCAIMQMLDGVKANEIEVAFIIGDEATPEYKAIWPEEEINYKSGNIH